jgi:hypothetical protein
MDSRDLSGDCLRPSRQTVEDKPINNVLFIPRASNRFAEVVGHKRAPIFGHHRFKDCLENDPGPNIVHLIIRMQFWIGCRSFPCPIAAVRNTKTKTGDAE